MSLKEQEPKTSRSVVRSSAATESKSQANGLSYFVDNRPELVAQRKVIESMNTSVSVPGVAQLKSTSHANSISEPSSPNNTGLPDNLKSGIEDLSGVSMDDVKVHYNSSEPAQLQAHAYAQGNDIHLASGQEKHLPHEAWHVVQQKQGRVKPTIQLQQKVNVNDDAGLEKEADVMGSKASQHLAFEDNRPEPLTIQKVTRRISQTPATPTIQRQQAKIPTKVWEGLESGAAGQLQTAPSGSVLQMVRIDVSYNAGQGRLVSSLAYLATKDQAWYDSFPRDAFPAIFAAVDAIAHPTYADIASIGIIKNRVATAQANFDNRAFVQAPAGKQQAAVQGNYNEMRTLIHHISAADYTNSNGGFVQGEYGRQIATFTMASISGLNHSTNLYRLYYTPYAAIGGAAKAANAGLVTEITNLFSWLYPLDRGLVKGLNDINGIKTNLNRLLLSKISLLRERGGGAAALPEEALIKHAPTRTVRGQALGVESEIVTSKLGALKSGEKSEARELETIMTRDSGHAFVAGHLVAGSLGGKFAAYNLTPMTNTFNTTAGGMATPENAARTRLNAENKVIHYKVSVTYNNTALDNWRAFLPATIRVELSDVAKRLDGNAANIADYQVKSNTTVYTPNIGAQV